MRDRTHDRGFADAGAPRFGAGRRDLTLDRVSFVFRNDHVGVGTRGGDFLAPSQPPVSERCFLKTQALQYFTDLGARPSGCAASVLDRDPLDVFAAFPPESPAVSPGQSCCQRVHLARWFFGWLRFAVFTARSFLAEGVDMRHRELPLCGPGAKRGPGGPPRDGAQREGEREERERSRPAAVAPGTRVA